MEFGDFGYALSHLRKGTRLGRKGWESSLHGPMFIVLMPELYLPAFNTQDTFIKVNDRTAKHIGEDTALDSQPYIAMFTVDGKWQPGFIPSIADILAHDWYILE
ncbi:protein of unknown function DUF2829 [Vibrio phage 1.081.O._10N.286.52.C2]|nr:protein of unknown function DUF2829 [Vibrio phage 1.081.O._10N.286.52.C2]